MQGSSMKHYFSVEKVLNTNYVKKISIQFQDTCSDTYKNTYIYTFLSEKA